MLIIILKKSESSVKWFRVKNATVNRDKFQAIVLQKGNNNNTNITLNTEDIAISKSKSVKLLGITIDHKLNFEEHFSVP